MIDACLLSGITMVQEIVDSTKRLLFSLRFTILSIFITLIIITTLSIIVIRSITFSRELSFTAFRMMHYVTKIVQNQLTAAIRPAAIQSQFTARLFAQGVIKDDVQQLVPYTYNLIKAMPLAQRAFWADEQGDYIYALREENGSVTSDIFERTPEKTTRTILYRDVAGNVIKTIHPTDTSYDPRLSTWYQKTKKDRQFWWTNVHVFHPHARTGIGALSPIMDQNGQFFGVVGINISLNYLSQFISRLHVSKNGFAFIITADEDLVAYPFRPPFNNIYPQQSGLVNAHQVRLPLIDQTIDIYKQTQQKEFSVQYEDKIYLVTYDPVIDLKHYGWLIGVITPKNDFIGPLEWMNYVTIGVSLVILILGILIVSNLVSRIVKPINKLAKETEKIKRFELDDDIKIKSRITEVIHLAEAIRAMKMGLKSFQRYVPKVLVKQLIELNEDLRIGGVRKQLVVFFSDIKNFTSIAEKMDPNQLTLQLGEYFEALTHIIIDEKGTIDKYIGDSIMAFWGAPLVENAPSEHAARAALRCQAKIKELNAAWEREGKPALFTRIGIHAGEAIVGNLGSSERINYTALGDTINIANRLENINKIYETKIIVSATVYDAIKEQFVLRLVDRVAVRGRTASLEIYELLGADARRVAFDVHAYNEIFMRGFAAYEQKQWQTAIDYFKQCLVIYPADTVAPIFIARCEQQL